MKLVCTQENLNKALNIVGKVVNRNSTLPILNNILLKAEKNKIRLSSTNLEIGIDYWIGGKIEKQGEITVPSRLFSSYVSSLPNENIEISLKGDVLNLKCGGYKTKIKGLDAKEYPLAPKIEAKPLFGIGSSKFKQAIVQTIPAVSNSESRFEITGIFLNLSRIEKGEVVLVSTDSYRLAEKSLNLKKEAVDRDAVGLLRNSGSIIVPKNTMQELVRSLGDEEEVLKVTVSDSQILFSFGNANIVSRLINGNYPDYKQIIPEKFESKVIVSIDKITNAIKATSLFSNVSNNSVSLKLFSSSKILEIKSESGSVGSSRVKIPAEISGGDLETTYNHKYLIDGLNNVIGDNAVLKINSENMPTVITSDSDKSFLYVIMPIRT